jgi:hypothetical protein
MSAVLSFIRYSLSHRVRSWRGGRNIGATSSENDRAIIHESCEVPGVGVDDISHATRGNIRGVSDGRLAESSRTSYNKAHPSLLSEAEVNTAIVGE